MTYVTQFFLLLMGLGYIAFGFHSFFDPQNLIVSTSAENMTKEGVFELRSIYGGTSIAGGLLLLLASFKTPYKRPALYFIIIYMGGYTLARLAAVSLDGMPESGRVLGFWILHAFCVVVALILLKKSNFKVAQDD